jgi:8-oxo-dGTP pyrophosphatase MutT (NUDIX family)
MLHLIPAPLHRALYRLAHAGRRCWLRLRGGSVHGCSMIARDDAKRVLLVRHSYGGSGWEFPGGGIGKGETPEAAARREFAEEVECELLDLRHIGRIEEPYHGAINVVEVFAGRVEGEPKPDGREIVDFGFFATDALPLAPGGSAMRRLELLRASEER